MHEAFAVVGLVLGGLLLAGAAATVALVLRGRPPQPPRTAQDAVRVRGTWRRSWSYQRYVIDQIRRGAKGLPRR